MARTKKGVAGKKTGGATRKAIRSKSKCLTNAQIGARVGRSESTIAGTKSGRIANPPKGLAGNIRKIKVGKKCKK